MQQDNRAPQIFNQLFTRGAPVGHLTSAELEECAYRIASITRKTLMILDGIPTQSISREGDK